MPNRKTCGAVLGAAVLALIAAAPTPRPVYAEWQVWAYHTRPEDPFSLLRIDKIEVGKGSTVTPTYHISVIGVHLGGSAAPKAINHLPVSRQTLDNSVIKLVVSTAIFPDSSAGIAQWRAAHGGVFTIPVSEVVAIVDSSTK